ncbi:MAG: TRAP transporter large permease [Rhodospirillales bacterium]|nr:TRAP transporter large permease [Rhodospirillales bacterium]
MVWFILLLGLVATALIGMPIGLGLALTGLAILHFAAGGAETLAVTAVWNVFTDFTFSAVPIYIFMGEILLVSGVSTRIYNAVAPFFQRIPGQLLHTNIVVCTMFGAVCGASTSTAAAVGSVAYPELRARGYSRPGVVATLAAGGTLGLLIPPSLSLLIYGATQNVSIGRLFLAGILPGLMLAAMFMAAIYVISRRNPDLTPPGDAGIGWGKRLWGLARIWPFALLVFSVLGTMYLGLATATEAAALGVVAAIVVGVFWGELTPGKLWRAFRTATAVFGSIGLVVLGALVLAQSLSILGVPQQVMSSIAELGLSKYAVLLLIVILYLVLGCFFDGISLMLMTLPLVFPVMMGVGFDPVWTGVIITIMIEIGMLTPPVGMNLFVLVAITNGEVNLAQAARAALPYWILMLGGVAILTAIPGIALLLPNLVMGQ